jgi:hypothetical protein
MGSTFTLARRFVGTEHGEAVALAGVLASVRMPSRCERADAEAGAGDIVALMTDGFIVVDADAQPHGLEAAFDALCRW